MIPRIVVSGPTGSERITAASYNRLKTFERCPAALFFEVVQRHKDPQPNPAAERGLRIHDSCQHYIDGESDDLDPDIKFWRDVIEKLRTLDRNTMSVSADKKIALTKNFDPCDYFSDDVWIRYAFDVEVLQKQNGKTGLVIDWKTGKLKFNEVAHMQQKQLYCALQLKLNPELDTSIGEFYYVDIGTSTSHTFTRKQGEIILNDFIKRIDTLTSTTEFEAKPSRHACKFCPYTPSRMNICPAGVDC